MAARERSGATTKLDEDHVLDNAAYLVLTSLSPFWNSFLMTSDLGLIRVTQAVTHICQDRWEAGSRTFRHPMLRNITSAIRKAAPGTHCRSDRRRIIHDSEEYRIRRP